MAIKNRLYEPHIMSTRSKLNFENLVIYGEKRREISPYFLFIEPLQWNKEKHKGHVKPHLHSSLFQIILIKKGGLFFKSNHVQKLVTEPTIILIPEDNLHSLKFEQPTEGWTLSFSLSMMDELLEKYPSGFSYFQSVRLIEHSNENPYYDIILNLCKQIYAEQNKHQSNQWIFNVSSIGLILYYINKFFEQADTNNTYTKESKEYTHLRKFKKMIKERVDAGKKVRDYAAELNITPTHLNRLCNSLTGISASQTIYNILIAESKKYLTHSTFTISEIAYRLNFKSPSHFSKFFRNQNGLSPKHYREQEAGKR